MFGEDYTIAVLRAITNPVERDKPAEILLVEDRASEVELMREALQDCHISYCLHVVRNGEEALTFLHRQGTYQSAPRPDLILLDLNLPKLNGREVLAVIKADHQLKLIPVVVLTTTANQQDIIQSYDLHANCCITKPADLDQFIDVIQLTVKFWLTVVALPLTIDKHW